MAKKRQLLITDELDFYEKKVEDAINYVDSINLAELKDRIEMKPTAKGGVMPMVIASIEQQVKSYFDAMEKIPKLLAALEELRQKYADRVQETRGDVDLPALMQISEDE